MAEQSFENHAKIVPGYHYFVFGVLALNLLWALYRLVVAPGIGTAIAVLLALALAAIAFYALIFALAVQDRVIRLEMRLRLRELLPADLVPRIGELKRGQFVALRFASDAELPDLVREVLAGRLTAPKDIKRAIKSWQADHLRA